MLVQLQHDATPRASVDTAALQVLFDVLYMSGHAGSGGSLPFDFTLWEGVAVRLPGNGELGIVHGAAASGACQVQSANLAPNGISLLPSSSPPIAEVWSLPAVCRVVGWYVLQPYGLVSVGNLENLLYTVHC